MTHMRESKNESHDFETTKVLPLIAFIIMSKYLYNFIYNIVIFVVKYIITKLDTCMHNISWSNHAFTYTFIANKSDFLLNLIAF